MGKHMRRELRYYWMPNAVVVKYPANYYEVGSGQHENSVECGGTMGEDIGDILALRQQWGMLSDVV